ncbi:uncharacterized protein LOC6525975 isoform X2 [Drosophila yakuba]|uniref:Uncharacterized protein, isoform C n=1 Tax=Drosophila yakuba TaxID=7245 RepID=A0A0R1ECB9_DROYA|nr:uncharacterized protein LOC6525975 isoform X2 [Drosophila yakuba]KRK07001.1 uncharacterized protein Dyak_GE15419, isoform C [Drosophila yakuba]
MSSTSSSVLTLSSFNLLFFTQVLTVLSSTIKYNEYATDKGGNVSIPCIAQGNIMWVKEHGNNSTIVQTGRVLVLRNVSTTDAGIYVCFASVPRPTTTATAATSATTSLQNQKEKATRPLEDEDGGQGETVSPKETGAVQQEVEMEEEVEYLAHQRTKLIVRTVPGPVSQLYFKASTILGFLIWRFNKTQSGGYPVRSFTAEYRNVSYKTPPANASFEHAWSRMDPINIAFNVRQMEVYRLAPNTTYEFRIWANNELGSGEVVTTNVTTLPETKEEELQDGWDSIELIPNIILNPGFSESDGGAEPGGQGHGGGAGDQDAGEDDDDDVAMPFPRTIIFGQHHRTPPPPRLHLPPQHHRHQNQSHHHHHHHRRQDDDDDDDYEEEHEPTMERFKRKVSVFFTGPTIKRI